MFQVLVPTPTLRAVAAYEERRSEPRPFAKPMAGVSGTVDSDRIAVFAKRTGHLIRCDSGSIWVTSLAHAATNAIGGSLTLLVFLGGGDFLYVSYLGLLGWVPLGSLCVWLVASGRLKPRIEKSETDSANELK